ncbi:MAG: hypothetical protein ACOYMR_18120, partial [Ilumatobacteraceae bacterium]
MRSATVAGEIELVSDGDGLAVFGHPTDVELFLQSEGLQSKPISVRHTGNALHTGSAVAQAGADIAASSGQWVKLTSESAAAVKKYGLMDSKTPGVSHAMVGKPGEIKQWIQIAKTPGSMLTNPAMLAGAAGVMSQLAMQQQMSEITDYLARIDEKLDAVLRMQTNQVLARLDGVELALREAATVRSSVGRVSDVTWSKVQNSSTAIMETQGLALRQLSDLADKIEQATAVGNLAKITKDAEADVKKWLSVLARCAHLHDAVSVLELERVLDADPDELDRHRMGLKAARDDRRHLISTATWMMMDRMAVAAGRANANVLLHPTKAPGIVESSNSVTADIAEFQRLLAIEAEAASAESRRWSEAAGETWDKALGAGADGLGAVKKFGGDALGQVGSAKDKITGKLGGLRLRRGSDSG